MAGAAIAGVAIMALGQIQAGQAAKQQADAQATIQRQQAAQERAKASLEASDFRKRASAAAARNIAVEGASGGQIGTGSSLLAAEDFASESDIQQNRILLGGDIRGTRLEQQALLTKASGKSKRRASFFRAGGTVLSGASSFGGGGGGGDLTSAELAPQFGAGMGPVNV